MVTQAQNAANLRTASRNVAARLGVDPAALTYNERIRYNKELAAEILRYPQSFTDATLSTARTVAGQEYSALEDTSFDFGAFVDETAERAKVVLPVAGLAAAAGLLLVLYFLGLAERRPA